MFVVLCEFGRVDKKATEDSTNGEKSDEISDGSSGEGMSSCLGSRGVEIVIFVREPR